MPLLLHSCIHAVWPKLVEAGDDNGRSVISLAWQVGGSTTVCAAVARAMTPAPLPPQRTMRGEQQYVVGVMMALTTMVDGLGDLHFIFQALRCAVVLLSIDLTFWLVLQYGILRSLRCSASRWRQSRDALQRKVLQDKHSNHRAHKNAAISYQQNQRKTEKQQQARKLVTNDQKKLKQLKEANYGKSKISDELKYSKAYFRERRKKLRANANGEL